MISVYQDVIGQLPILKTYNHGTLGFKIENESDRAEIVLALEDATRNLTANFPWLAGAVVNEGSGPGNSGTFKVVDWPESASSSNGILSVRDYTNQLPSFAEFVRKKAPCSMIDGKLVASYPGFPESYQDSAERPSPILAIQANFIREGLLLNFSSQHNAIDASGMMQVIGLFSKAMQGTEFSSTAIREGNRDRNTLIPLIPPGEPIKDHSHLQIPPDYVPSPAFSFDQVARWGYFLMDASAVPKIKAAALQYQENDPSVPFISSNDALSAFFWKCLADVRTQNGRSPKMVTKFLRAIDVRRAMAIPPEYMGHMVYHAATRMTFKDLQESHISTVARKLRTDLNEANNQFSVRSYVTYIANTPDKSRIIYGGLFNRDTDVGASAVANADFFHSFGVIGRPLFARRPDLAPIPGCVYFMPHEAQHLPILVCLRDDDMVGLKNHPQWGKITEFIG
ncbi:uncharacterized protein N7506_004837 [Penicillium brevicompactum]|uniref:uncharacterized protein n=1 Tax=Penicillium brevicompactum TaxID=5074 RepID=UPI0025415ECB|nr:uncharacterized protein N7506_004837 [Penicillium brevicompactum]KAJ5336815.1 hypothetical protein N7506_004837 [Penicillium brevicompactum]